jgi:hypothetical protein
MSIAAKVGIHYQFIPDKANRPLRQDKMGRSRPDVHSCHRMHTLQRPLDQTEYVSALSFQAERNRRDLWWIEHDGRNLQAVAEDLAFSLLREGTVWLRVSSELEAVLADIEGEKDCLEKYRKAQYFAEYLGYSDKAAMYADLANREQLRIDATSIQFLKRRSSRKA